MHHCRRVGDWLENRKKTGHSLAGRDRDRWLGQSRDIKRINLSVGLDVRSNKSDSDGTRNRAFAVCICEAMGEYGECVVETLVALQGRRY